MSIIFFFTFFSFLLLSFTQLLLSSTHTPTHNRRALHQSFFPLTSSPSPAQPPSPSFPKYPSSSSSSQNNQRPFFPRYSSPPPPPSPTISSSLPTFPANISSILSPPRHRSPAKLAPAIALPLLALVLVAISLGLILLHLRRRRRRRAAGKDARSDSLRLFPPNSTASDGRKLSSSSSSAAPAASDFLYLGTLVSSRGRADESAGPAAASGSPYRKLGSPELHPLPPLPRQCRNADGGGGAGGSSEDEFFSPKGSPGQKGSPRGPTSSSRKAFAMEKCGSRSSTQSSASYPSSIVASLSSPSSPTTSSPPVGLSPGRSAVKSRSSRAESIVVGDGGTRSSPPPPPLSLLRPQTPSPPKRKPSSPSPPYSPPAVDTGRKAATLELPSQSLISPRRIGDFARNPFAVSMPQRQISPPPPPPPPPAGYWEGQNPKMLACRPPVLMPPRTSGMRNSSATVFPAGPPENLNGMEKSQHNLRPKLKPLHWDKVRASSDRAMVWDQLKSSSFQ